MSDFSRRRFMGIAAAAAGGLALVGVPLASAVGADGVNPGLVRSTFTPLVGQTFELWRGGVRSELTLASVEDLPSGGEPETRFSLSFDGGSGSALDQGVYDLVRGQLRHALLVVPVDRGVVRPRYQVVVNNPAVTP